MRLLILILVLTPLLSKSQINRSANELARETTRDFIEKKLFKGQAYTPGAYGEIISFRDKRDLEIEWKIEHQFEITRPPGTYDKNSNGLRQTYKFTFYLNHEMKVRRAESFSKT